MDTQRPSALERTAQRFARELKGIDDAAVRKMLSAYEPGRKRIFAQLVQLMDEIDRTGIVSAAEAFKLERWIALIQQIETEMNRIAPSVTREVTEAQAKAVQQAQQQAPELFDVQMQNVNPATRTATVRPSFNRVPTDAMGHLVGRMQDGSPVREWMDGLGKKFAATVEQELTAGMAEGNHPSVISTKIAKEVNVTQPRRMETMVRDQVVESHRAASLEQYAENDDILNGWMWFTAHDDRACGACLALDGRPFPTTQKQFRAHSRCRCTPVPLVKGFDLPERETGEEWLKKQPAEYQDRLLGKEGGAAFRKGEVELGDFVKLERDEKWGDRYVQGSFREAKRKAATRGNDIDWQPSMSRADAERFASKSDLPAPMFHGTSTEAGESIRAEGFDLGQFKTGRTYGNGVYMSEDRAIAEGFGETLELRVNSRRTLRAPLSGDSWEAMQHVAAQENGITVMAIQGDYNRTLDDITRRNARVFDEIKSLYPFDERAQERERERAIRERRYLAPPAAEAQAQTLERYGYDAVELKSSRESIVVVFDPRRVVVVERDEDE